MAIFHNCYSIILAKFVTYYLQNYASIIGSSLVFTSWGIIHSRLNIMLFQDHVQVIDNGYYNYRNNLLTLKQSFLEFLHWFIFFKPLNHLRFFKRPKVVLYEALARTYKSTLTRQFTDHVTNYADSRVVGFLRITRFVPLRLRR